MNKPGRIQLMPQISIVLRLIIVIPATNAGSERSFSTLHTLKTYLRASMKQKRLNHLMILHIHDNLINALNLIDVCNEFVSRNEARLSRFGNFLKMI